MKATIMDDRNVRMCKIRDAECLCNPLISEYEKRLRLDPLSMLVRRTYWDREMWIIGAVQQFKHLAPGVR